MIKAIAAALFAAATQAAPALPPAISAPPPPPPTATQIADAAPASAWARIPDDDVMLIDFVDGKRVTIWLASGFAPVHVANIRTIARAGWWRDASVYRVQDNYVTQWGDATEAKAPAPGITLKPPAEYEWPAAGRRITPNPFTDAYARITGFSDDGLVEAIERPDRRFAMGVQWHPERLIDETADADALFGAFVAAALEWAKASRLQPTTL
jgi:peptidylprolyl isomerase